MHIKVHSKKPPTGIPRARVAVAHGVLDNGQPQITVFVSALDAHDMPTVIASLRLSPAEAMELAAHLQREAAK